MIPPGSTIGILGGGQLGRMLALAAANMGYRCHIFAPEAEVPAGDVAARVTRADYTDFAALEAFADEIDVATYEFENVDTAAVRHLATLVPVRPGAESLEVAQDRLAEKRFAEAHGGRAAGHAAVDSRADLDAALAGIGCPSVLKTRRMGYDGKGQARITTPADADQAFAAMRGSPAILEAWLEYSHEFSIILARGLDGAICHWPVAENRHVKGVLASSHVPAPPAVLRQVPEARAIAERVAHALGHVGVLTLEFFATADGPRFNEIAPRVHNSGHWTIEGARASQFENHVRAVCGLPLGAPDLTAREIRMQNLLGEEVHDWARLLADPEAHLHLYGKAAVQPGRKMGHVTWLSLLP
ncbi:5-(carboxyamino)imidazole ribonucleotide synthase [Polymorphobacter multimanifer]|uniref:N5-carboxyaminoimidazole ribonucleotide synthase n=1 Tax=Polymorphobacter multimanifer TaxID=1070431 RepID=A0A841L5D1_9SPHN|nr:5-(carboxyamino)imidazole ribonucleotide synthase [Polymorphobacter multimanifer]MBB6227814.1 5-(carboxyamino)imidazole ribonucleotide synthase [Polymorphobacter multimanifer]